MKPNVRGINLLPREYILAQKIKTYILIAAAALLLECVIFVFTAVLPPIQRIKDLDNHILNLQVELGHPKFSEVNQTLEALNIAQEDIKKWNNKIGALKKEEIVNAKFFDQLVSRLPEYVFINSLDVKSRKSEANTSSETTVMIKGKAASTEVVVNYITIIETLYKDAVIDYKAQTANKDASFLDYEISVKIPAKQILVQEPQPQETAEPVQEGGNE